MPTSRTSILSKPTGADPIAPTSFGYLRARIKQSAYDLVIKEFKKSGLSQADLAKRLGKPNRTDQICKLLGGPGNWTLETVSDLMFAISGGVVKFDVMYPLEKAAKNFRGKSDLRAERSALLNATALAAQANTSPSFALGGDRKGHTALDQKAIDYSSQLGAR
jgi:hypothetical protein